MRLADVDWTSWSPHDVAAVTYLLRGPDILLMHKKRGLGAGKINAPGGRLEAGETTLDAAMREFREEVGLTIVGPLHEVAEHRHEFVDGLRLQIHAFVAEDATGSLVETDEARPFWIARDAIPFEKMWADNRLWLPQVLMGARADGRYIFDGDVMRDFDVHLTSRDG